MYHIIYIHILNITVLKKNTFNVLLYMKILSITYIKILNVTVLISLLRNF